MSAALRQLWPGLCAALVLALLAAGLDGARAAGLPLALANAAALACGVLVAAAPVLLHPVAFFRGAGPLLRTATPLLPFALWWLGELLSRWQLHPLPEALYLTLALPNLLLLQLLMLEIALSEAACRTLTRQRPGRGWLLAAAALTWLASDAVLGLPYFLGFQRAHVALFGGPAEGVRAAPPAPAVVSAPPARLPNLLVILSDDHRHDFTGHAGHPFVETPQLDRLAAEGARFTRAFVTSSLCSPSRASFLTGLEPAQHGVRNNTTPWSDANRTFFEYLKPLGYRTAFIGKWHMPGGLPQLRGVDRFVSFTAVGGQGVYRDCPLVVDGRPEPSRRSYIAEELTDRALAFIEEDPEAPFVLFLSHKNVHFPFTPDAPEAGRYRSRPVPLPPGAPHSWYALTRSQYVHLMLEPGETLVRRYAESVASLDREIGRVLDRLDALDLSGRTVVVYTSDNGYLWGEHGLVDKRWAYEASIRVPLLVRHPGLTAPGTRVERMILNLDLAPTLLDAAGVPVPAHMQGQSWLPLLRDPDAPWRSSWIYAYDFEAPYPVPALRAVRTEHDKLVEPAGGEPQLFNLVRDPEERVDLSGTPEGAARMRQLRGLLVGR